MNFHRLVWAAILAMGCFSFVGKAFSQSVAPTYDASETVIEFRSQSDPSLQSMDGYHQVPLNGLKVPYGMGTRYPPRPIEVQTRATISRNTLFGLSEFAFESEDANRLFTLVPFNPGIVSSPTNTPIQEVHTSPSKPVYFDQNGNAVFRIDDRPTVTLWSLDGEVDADAPSQRTYTLTMPWASKSKFELTLESQLTLSSSNVPFALKQNANNENNKDVAKLDSRTWELDCGLVRELKITVEDSSAVASNSERVFGTEQIDWIVQSSGLELNASYVFDSTYTPEKISLTVDPRIHIRSVTWDQQPIEWSYDIERQSISINALQVDGTYAGTQHRLVINGVSQLNVSQSNRDNTLHQLPGIHLSKSLAIDGRGSISLHSDWELVDFYANNATLVSRSGTTVRGGISRLDFSWRLARPELGIKLLRRKRLRAANVFIAMTSDRDDAIATAKVRVNADSEIWSTLALNVGTGWKLESCEVENSTALMASITNGATPESSDILISPPVENQVVDLSIRLRSHAPLDNSSQFVNLPRTVPLWLNEVKQNSILEYLPPSGYALERSADLVHDAVNYATLDTWHQSQVLSRDHVIQLHSKDDLLSTARFIRQRPGIATRSVVYINKSWGAYRCDYLLECSPDQAGIQILDLQIPASAKNLIWRILNKDRKELQEWKWAELSPDTDREANEPLKNIPLVSDQLLNEPFILECQYLLPIETSDISMPQVEDLVNRNSYVLTEDDLQIKLLTNQGMEDAHHRDELLVHTDDQNSDINSLLSIIGKSNSDGYLYLIESQNRTFRLQANTPSSSNIVIDRSIETVFCQSDGSLVYELELKLADLQHSVLKISLPKPWNVITASGAEAEYQYVVRDVDDRLECELSNISNNNASNSLKIRWLGPSVNLKYGYGAMTLPTIQGNFQSVSHVSKVLVHENFLVPRDASTYSQRALLNLNSLSEPWSWGKDFILQTDNFSSSVRTGASSDRNRLGFTDLTPQSIDGVFHDFAAKSTEPANVLPVIDSRFVLLLRWVVVALSFFVATVLMRYSGWFAPWIICVGLTSAILLITPEFVVTSVVGLVLAIVVQLAYSVTRSAKTKQDSRSIANGGSEELSTSELLRRSPPALNATRILLICATLQSAAWGQEPDLQPQITNDSSAQAAFVVPFDLDTLRIAPYAWVNDRFKQIDTQADDASPGFVLLSADHVLECKKHQDILFKLEKKTSIASTYRFRINDETSSVTLPFDIHKAKLVQFAVDEEVLSYGQHLSYGNSGLIWKPNQKGEFSVQVKFQLIQKPPEGPFFVQTEILPCAASQISIQTDINELSLLVDGRPAELNRSSPTIAIGNMQNLELRWRSESSNATIQYDADTLLFLNQSQPIAVTRFHIVGGTNLKKDLTLEWNRNWKPVGDNFRDATKGIAVESSNIAFQRCKISLLDSPKLSSGSADIEIYWQPVNESSNSLALPDPKIVEAIPNIRSLRFAKNTKSAWSVTGTDNWSTIASGTSTNLASATSTNSVSNMVSLRIPDSGAPGALQNNLASQDKVNVQVDVDYLIGSSSSSVHWQGSLVPSYVRTKTQSWIIDNRLTIDAIKINNQEALFAVDRFSEEFNLVRAIGDSEGELISSVEIFANTIGYSTLANRPLPLINWCNVKVIQSSFNVSRLVGLPTTLDNLPLDTVLGGKIFQLENSEYRLPFAEVIATGEESVPYELERPQSKRDDVAVKGIVDAISRRDLAKVQCQLSPTLNHVIDCSAVVKIREDVWRFEFNCDLNTSQKHDAIVLALPIADALRIKSKSAITRLGEIGDSAYIYLAADPDYSDENQVRRISFWMDQKIDSSKSSLDVPEIDFISAPSLRCILNVNDNKRDDLIWDVSHWLKNDQPNSQEHDDTSNAREQSSQYVSTGKIAAIHVEPKPSTKIDVQVPFAYWSIQKADAQQLVLEGVVAVNPKGTSSATLLIPSYLQQAAIIQLSADSSDVASKWRLLATAKGDREVSISFRPTDLPHIIAIRGNIANESLANLEINSHDFQLITSDGTTITPAKNYLGLSPECNLAIANGEDLTGISNAIAMRTLTEDLLNLLQNSKSNIDRLATVQHDEYLSKWANLIQRTGISDSANMTSGQLDWISKYQQLFLGIPPTNPNRSVPVPISYANASSINWYPNTNSTLKLVGKSTNAQKAYLFDILMLCIWAVPLALLSLVLLPMRFAQQLRSILQDYPWRLLCLLAVSLAIVPGLLWLSLLLSSVALIICLLAFNRHNFGLN